jgi:hypothetical protein
MERQSLQTIRKIPLMCQISFLRWVLLLEEYGVTLEYLPEKKKVVIIVDSLSCLQIDSLKIQEEEALNLLSGSVNSNISNINFPCSLLKKVNIWIIFLFFQIFMIVFHVKQIEHIIAQSQLFVLAQLLHLLMD